VFVKACAAAAKARRRSAIAGVAGASCGVSTGRWLRDSDRFDRGPELTADHCERLQLVRAPLDLLLEVACAGRPLSLR
jgi:hypothetical protein